MTPFLQSIADSFEKSYGIRVDSIGSLLLAIAFIVLAAIVWPIVIKFMLEISSVADDMSGMTSSSANITSNESSKPGGNITGSISRPPLTKQQLAIIMEENSDLRRSMECFAKRLEDNELLAAKLQTALINSATAKS